MNAKQHTRVGIGLLVLKWRWTKPHVLLHRRAGSHGAGEFSTIGGHLEYGESFLECALREKDEEVGKQFIIDNVQFLHVCNTLHYMPKHYVHIGLIADWVGGKALRMEPDKGEGWKWYPIEKLPKPLFQLADISIDAFKNDKIYRDAK